jgi:hypothetical protein
METPLLSAEASHKQNDLPVARPCAATWAEACHSLTLVMVWRPCSHTVVPPYQQRLRRRPGRNHATAANGPDTPPTRNGRGRSLRYSRLPHEKTEERRRFGDRSEVLEETVDENGSNDLCIVFWWTVMYIYMCQLLLSVTQWRTGVYWCRKGLNGYAYRNQDLQ